MGYIQQMTISQKQFMALLRAGLWGKEADAELFRGGVDWKTVFSIASEQTVAVIVADGIETLPPDLWPPKEVVMKLMMLRMKTGQMHALLNSTLNKIVRALDAEKVHSVLLKGQGVAQNYLKPESRSCGDIDLYTGVNGYEKACAVIEGLNNEEHKPGQECEHHMHLSLNGVEVEVHRKTSFLHGRRMDANFQQWTRQSLDELFGCDALEVWYNDGTAVTLPPATYNAFFILHHAVRHMTTEGVGFRQICDWVMLLHRYYAEIDAELLAKKLKELRMERIWNEFGRLAVGFLGLPASELPLAPANLTPGRKTHELLRHIFLSGNFGRFDANGRDRMPRPYLVRKWHSFTFQSLRLMKLFNLFPGYSLSYMWNWFTGAIVRLIMQSDR